MRRILVLAVLTVALCGWLCGPAAAQPSPFGGAVRPATGDCTADAGAWLADLQRIEQRPLTVIVFAGSVPCFRTDTRRPAVYGDPIYVGVLTQTPSLWAGVLVSLTPCDIEPSSPLIQPGVALEAAEMPRWVLLTALPKSCWTETVSLVIRGESFQAGYLLTQFPRYRATVHVGTIFSEHHDDAVGRGPEYTALVVLYGVLRYMPSLGHGRPYKGREIRNEHQLLDRLGLAVGVSVTHPQRRFVTGATFELLPGVSLFAGYERVSLSGQWRGARVAGLTLDAAYAAKLAR